MNKPDMFVDPEGYDRWLQSHISRSADIAYNRKMDFYLKKPAALKRLNASLAKAAKKYPRKLSRAYAALRRLRKTKKAHQLLYNIIAADSPSRALMKWHAERNKSRRAKAT